MSKWEVKKAVETAVDKLAEATLVQKFYPTYISSLTGYSLKDVLPVLMSFVEDGRLIFELEIRCPNYDCGRTIKTIRSTEDIKDIDSLNCICGEEIEVTTEDLFPVFSFSEDYRRSLANSNNKSNDIKKKLPMKYHAKMSRAI